MLLNGLLMPLLESLHLLLLLVATMDSFAYRATYWATDVLTSMVVAEDIPRTHTVWDQTLLILTFGNVLPQSLHTSTVRSYRTPSIIMLALGGMSKK